MLSPVFQQRFMGYLCVASSSILLWDILDNVRNDYRLLFWHRIRLPTVVYILSRIAALGFIFTATIYFTTPVVQCTAFKAAIVSFFISYQVFTPFLAYLRVCAVWNWNRFIVVIFGISWLSVVASSFILVPSLKGINFVGNYCTLIIEGQGQHIFGPFITTVINHTVVFMAVTYGVFKNTMGQDQTLKDFIRLMLGKSLPTFSKALLHDSQVSYIIITISAAMAVIWYYAFLTNVPLDSAFRLALVPPYSMLTNVMICRVFRHTKLGLSSKISSQSNDLRSHTHNSPTALVFLHNTTDCRNLTPIQFGAREVVEHNNKYPPPVRTSANRSVDCLDFGGAV